jgi:hypothetical protein
MWQIFRNAILTRDNMKRRKWPGNPVCSFCLHNESIEHLFFLGPVARVVWSTIGRILGTARCPSSLWQSVYWFYAFLPGGEKLYGGNCCCLLGYLDDSEQNDF